jgi:membrane associated rhomboid family serine protease
MSNNKMYEQPWKDIPVSVFFAVSIIIVFSLYLTTAIKTIPCGNDVMSSFLSNFVHVDSYHLMANLFALYSLSRVEQNVGTKRFLGLIVFLLIFNTLAETIVHKAYPNMPCSIGFSGILFGIMTWEIVTKKQLDLMLVFSIVAMVVIPSIQNPKASLLGHSVGAIAGVVGGLVWKKLSPVVGLNGH